MLRFMKPQDFTGLAHGSTGTGPLGTRGTWDSPADRMATLLGPQSVLRR